MPQSAGALDSQKSSIIVIHMRAIQFTIDERLLARIDRDPEAKQIGRSAVIRRAIAAYLARKRTAEIREAYRRGYGASPPSEDEVGPWHTGQAWPDE